MPKNIRQASDREPHVSRSLPLAIDSCTFLRLDSKSYIVVEVTD